MIGVRLTTTTFGSTSSSRSRCRMAHKLTPPPYMEVKDANGNWVRVPDSRQFPIPPDIVPRTFVVDLTGLFPTNDYSLRISNFWNVTFDYIGVDITPQENVTIQRINPYADLYQAFTHLYFFRQLHKIRQRNSTVAQ